MEISNILILTLTFITCESNDKVPKIVIIGSGPSGIAAATYLLEHNLSNFIVLEAEPRIGGRIKSVQFGNSFIDLGAQWCHGEEHNIVYETVKDLGLLEHPNYTIQRFHSSEGLLNDDFVKELNGIAEDIDLRVNSSGPNFTVGQFFSQEYKSIIEKHFVENSEKLKIAHDCLEFYHTEHMSSDGAFSWFDIAAQSSYVSCKGDLSMIWKDRGYITFLLVLMKKFPDPKYALPINDKILLNKEVNKIVWTQNSTMNPAVRIVCTDGSVYEADHVIFTPSIGVLKEKADQLFSPYLPLKKRKAIQNIGFAAVMKIFFYYEKPWWKHKDIVEIIWSEEDKKNAVKEFPEGPNLAGRSWVTFASAVVKEKYNPNVMSIWITGYLVPQIELLPEQILKDGIKYIFDKFFGDKYSITKPDKLLTTNWYNNSHFKGTYSFQTLKSCKKESCAENILAEPIRNEKGLPVIQFAGEATHPYYYSTVHGAVETGRREARALIDIYGE